MRTRGFSIAGPFSELFTTDRDAGALAIPGVVSDALSAEHMFLDLVALRCAGSVARLCRLPPCNHTHRPGAPQHRKSSVPNLRRFSKSWAKSSSCCTPRARSASPDDPCSCRRAGITTMRRNVEVPPMTAMHAKIGDFVKFSKTVGEFEK